MKTTSAMQSITETITRLESKLQSIAWKYSWLAGNEKTEEDIYQDVVLGLIETALKDPEFTGKEDTFVLTSARWIASKTARKCYTYSKYVSAEPEPTADNGEVLDWFDTIVGDIDPAEHYRNREFARELSAAIASLPDAQQIIVKDLYHEVPKKETAAKLGISPAAVSQQVKTLRKRLTACMPA